MSKQVGLDMLLYRNASTYGSPSWQLIENVRDLTGPDSFVEADVSIRGNGLKAAEPTLEDISFEWEMVHDPDDGDFNAVLAAFTGKALIEFAFADGPIATNGTKYLRIETKVFKFDRAEPLEGANTRAIMVKPCWGARKSVHTVGA
jgi:hypothetical protein